jgi:hypothetical protein
MTQRRWQPPPFCSERDATRVTVDEQVVRKLLAVNPQMRKGRTTFQVKKAIERGEPVLGEPARNAPEGPTPAACTDGPMLSRPAANELQKSVDFFVDGKARALGARLDEIETRRRALVAEEKRAKSEVAEQVVAFLALLDPSVVAAHGKRVLARHVDFLTRLGLTPAVVIDEILSKNKQR